MPRRAADYVGGGNPADGLISPVFAELPGLAPLLIHAGTHGLGDARRLAARVAAEDVAVTFEVTPGVPHASQAFAATLDEADVALMRAESFLRNHLRTGRDRGGASRNGSMPARAARSS